MTKTQNIFNSLSSLCKKFDLRFKRHARAMQATDKQYERMHILIGKESVKEKM